ncbi:hypothetical protein DFH09DRAFT_1097854 [Mycena vulgaris]|nr:hypothetical protein DFH09DRAFT_1113565 [Mycena vulgaris]KAJ6521252.1 hypothetical protein DFH09DRAFT_1097854 [Mycena vulgaris]
MSAPRVQEYLPIVLSARPSGPEQPAAKKFQDKFITPMSHPNSRHQSQTANTVHRTTGLSDEQTCIGPFLLIIKHPEDSIPRSALYLYVICPRHTDSPHRLKTPERSLVVPPTRERLTEMLKFVEHSTTFLQEKWTTVDDYEVKNTGDVFQLD